MSNSDVYLFTRIRMQRWHLNSLGTVLCETVAMLSLSAPPTVVHIRCWADISHILSQMMLGISRLGYSCWWLVTGYMCGVLQYGICRRYYVTAERRWQPDWVGVWYQSRMQVSYVHCLLAQTAFTATVTGTHIGQYGAHRWTNNADQRWLSHNSHLPPKRRPNRRQVSHRVPPCRPLHGNNMSFNSVS